MQSVGSALVFSFVVIVPGSLAKYITTCGYQMSMPCQLRLLVGVGLQNVLFVHVACHWICERSSPNPCNRQGVCARIHHHATKQHIHKDIGLNIERIVLALWLGLFPGAL